MTNDDIRKVALRIRDLREALLFGEDAPTASSDLAPFAEQHYLSALAHLDIAEREMKLAALHSQGDR